MVYLAALASQVLSASCGGLPVFRYWIYGVVQLWFWGGVVLSAREWVRFWQVFVMKGVDNV